MATKAATFSSKIRNLNDYYNNMVNASLPVTNTGADVAATLKYFLQSLSTILKDVTLDESNIEQQPQQQQQQQQVDHNLESSCTSINKLNAGTDLNEITRSNINLKNVVDSSYSLSNILAQKPSFPLGIEPKEDKLYSNANRFKKFPNLNYSTLYHSLINIIELIPTLQINQVSFGQTLIQTFGYLAPFLTDDLIESLPYTIALTLTTFPRDLHKCIIDTLCNSILPIAIYVNRNDDSYLLNSIPSILMIVIEFGNDITFNIQIFECLLALKRNLIQDILCSIAYGSYKVRYHATNLLFRYWPKLNPNKSDRNIHYHFIPRKPLICQSERCIDRKNVALKVCIDPNFAMHGSVTPPPYNVCNECYREISKKYQMYCHNIVQPAEEISLYCENRSCKATDKVAFVVCYSSPCIILNQNKPITLCKECHNTKHNRLMQRADHIYQHYIDNIWSLDAKTKSYLTTSIINLLKEVPLFESKKNVEIVGGGTRKRAASTSMPLNPNQLGAQAGAANFSTNTAGSNMPPGLSGPKGDLNTIIGVGLIGALNNNGFSNTSALATNLFSSGSSSVDDSSFNKRLLSRFGCYLIVTLINPNEFGNTEVFGKIVSMILEWFHLVCYIPSDSSGEIISKLRTQYILPWIKSVTEKHFELVVSCLIPFPPEFAQVGGVWETKSNKSTQVKEEFSKFCDLIPYEIVTFEVWDYAMPFWIEAILNDVTDKHIHEFKTLFIKLFDPDMIPFSHELTYRFISERFDGTSSTVQEQALSWLQILSELDVSIPMNVLLSMFHTGLNSLQKLETRAMRRREAYASSLAAFAPATSTSSNDNDFTNWNFNNNAFTVFDTYEAYRVYRNQLMLLQMTGQELAMLIKEEEEDFIINNSELNITCCIMMLDMILKQIDTQKLPQYLGVYTLNAKEILLLLSKHLILPWAKKHKCKQQFGFLSAESISATSNVNTNYCQFCEEYVLWFSFAKDIIVHIAPKNEIELPDVNFHHLLETLATTNQNFKGSGGQVISGASPSHYANLTREKSSSPPPNILNKPCTSEQADDKLNLNLNSTPKKAASKTDPDTGIWVTSYGVYYFKFSQLQVHHQLLHSMLKELYRVPDVDAFQNLLICLKRLILHADSLESANKEQKGFLIYCLEKLLIPNLWRLFSADYVHLNEIGVPLLINSLTYESGKSTFWNLVDKDFKDASWKVRMQAVSRCISIAQYLDIKKIKTSCNIFSSLSFAFANLIFSVHDIEPLVSQKAASLLETLSDQAIRCIVFCFEMQFDCVIADRPMILQILDIFYSSLPAKLQIILTWEFFMNRFNSISFEAQLNNNILSPIDISGVNSNNNNVQRKLNMARFALKRSDFIKTINDDLPSQYVVFKKKISKIDSKSNLDLAKSPKLAHQQTSESKGGISKNSLPEEIKEANAAPQIEAKIENEVSNDDKPPEIPTDKRPEPEAEKNDKPDNTKESSPTKAEETSVVDIAKEQENLNKKTIHSLITLLLKFMVHDEQSSVNDDRILIKQQNVVLKHLYSLIKYNQNEQVFTVPPHILREITCVNAFMSGISKVMDKNFALGNVLLAPLLRLLRYLPLPANDENISIRGSQLNSENLSPHYTIGLLNSQTRQSWINTLIIILYKYQYNLPNDSQSIGVLIKHLIQIAINTLKFQFHRCEILGSDPFKINPEFNKTRLSQDIKENSSFTNDNESALLGRIDNDDEISNKSLFNKYGRLSTKKLLNIESRSKSNSPTIFNQAKNKKLKGIFKKGIKVNAQDPRRSSELGTISKPKNSSLKKDTEYETVLLDNATTSKDSKTHFFSFNLSKLFRKSKKSNIALKKVKKPTLRMNQSLPSVKESVKPTSSFRQDQNTNVIKISHISRRSAVTCNLDSGEYDAQLEALEKHTTLYLVMNSKKLDSGEYGLSYLKCLRCNRRLELYSEDVIGGLIVICGTYVHRESAQAAPFIIDMIMVILKIASKKIYGWQGESNFYFPGNYTSVAKQFLRCVLHQLVRNEIFYQLFQCDFESMDLFETLSQTLTDFNELSSVTALRHVIKDINLQKSINMETTMIVLNNAAHFIDYLPLESQLASWSLVLHELEILFRQLEPVMVKSYDYTCIFLIMQSLLKVSVIANSKTILEPFAKLLCFILRNCSFKLENLIDICSLSNRAFPKDRDKQYLPRCITNELIQSITVKVNCMDRNLLLILQLILLDIGGNIYKSTIIEDEADVYDPHYCIQTNAADCLKPHINDIIAFIADIHTLTKVKSSLRLDKHLQTISTDDSLGAQLKAGLAQFLALEFTELNKCKDRDSRSIVKYLPWLNNLPSNAQQGAKEFVECIDHIRFLSWIFIGSLTHSGLTQNKGTVISYPIPINCGHYIGEHIFYILNGFTEHSKTSAIHMSSLFHSFILCQLWTMYCEQIHVTYDTESDSTALNAIMEFWTKITPGILQLLSQTKVLADMVILHFLSLIEGLQEYNSLVLAKFFPMWVQVLFMTPLQGDQLKRAKQCLNYQPPTETQINTSANYSMLVKCLQRLQYKIAMIETQSSNAAQLLS